MQTHAGGGGGGKRPWNCVSVHTEEEKDRKRLQNCAGDHAEEEERDHGTVHMAIQQ